MKKLTVLLASMLLTAAVQGQKWKDIDAIPLNTKFVLELTGDDRNDLSYQVVSSQPFKGELKMGDLPNVFDKEPAHNQVQGIFAIGKFGSRKNILLVMKSGLDQPLQYDLAIDTKGRGKYKKTSTQPLSNNMPSTEIWPYHIQTIKIASFQEIELEPLILPEPKVDSTCILNPELTVANGAQLFRQHFTKVTNKLRVEADFPLETLLSFEDSINSADISPDHYYSLGEGIYPFSDDHKFANPLQFRRTECPYFDGYASYFYTKKQREVKVAGYEWNPFKPGNWATGRIDQTEMRNAFEQKYRSLKEMVTSILGPPLTLDPEPNSGRIDTRWKSEDGIHAYLFMFEKYNQIRLYVYRD